MLINSTELNGGVITEPVVWNTMDEAFEGLESISTVILIPFFFLAGSKVSCREKENAQIIKHIRQGVWYCVCAITWEKGQKVLCVLQTNAYMPWFKPSVTYKWYQKAGPKQRLPTSPRCSCGRRTSGRLARCGIFPKSKCPQGWVFCEAEHKLPALQVGMRGLVLWESMDPICHALTHLGMPEACLKSLVKHGLALILHGELRYECKLCSRLEAEHSCCCSSPGHGQQQRGIFIPH